MKTKRRESRETAFALLFEWSFKDDTMDEIIEQATVGRELAIDSFAYELAQKTIEYQAEVDACIEQYSERWKLNRLSRVTLSVLRMAFCEMMHFDNIPVGATINEAVELAKKYSTEDEAAYINGILGTYNRNRTGEEPDSSDEAADFDDVSDEALAEVANDAAGEPAEALNTEEPAVAAEALTVE